MKTLTTILFLAIPAMSHSVAGEIYGTVLEGGRAVGEGVEVEVRCDGRTYSAVTDQYGRYRVYVDGPGDCRVRVRYGEEEEVTNAIPVRSYQDPVRYNLVLEPSDEGYRLRRG